MAAAMQTTPPNNTVYVRNLDERIKIPALVESLRELFEGFGPVLDIVAKRNVRAKGQAFIVFEDAKHAAEAVEEIDGFELFDRQIQCEFAKTTSDATVKRQGTEADLEAHKRRRLAEKERRQAREREGQDTEMKEPDLKQKAQPPPTGLKPKKQLGGLRSTGGAAANAVVPDEYLPPNKTLFVQNVPEDYDGDSLSTIFSRFEGFREARLVPGRKGLAFVEYEEAAGAISAKEATSGMTLGDKVIKVTYQRQ